MHDPDRCGYGEGPDGCGSVQVTRVECGLGAGPKAFTWACWDVEFFARLERP